MTDLADARGRPLAATTDTRRPAATRARTERVPAHATSQAPELDRWLGRTVVLATRPGDELVRAAGLIARQRSLGAAVSVITVTDGVRSRHRAELEALEVLGVARTAIHRLELPTGAVTDHLGEIVVALTEVVEGHDVLVAPTMLDRSSDHRACAAVARRVAFTTGCRVVGFHPGGHPVLTGTGLTVARLDLTDDEVERREQALGRRPLGDRARPTLQRRRSELFVVGGTDDG